MTARTIIAALSAYAFCAVLTFGHAAANIECNLDRWQGCSEQSVASGFFAGTFWPFYWSWVAFDAEGRG